MKICCVIVTYNRVDLLSQVLAAVQRQTMKVDLVIVVNNNSTDGTDAFLSSLDFPELKVMQLPQNIGGAGGFKRGIAEACSSGADWIWCMDDDCIPDEDALEKLVSRLPGLNVHGEIGYLASRVEWKDGSLCEMNLPVAHRYWLEPQSGDSAVTRIIGSSFVSILLNSHAVRAVGLPVEEFFIWFDDAEYTRRISAQFPSFLVADSRVLHKTELNLKPLDLNYLDFQSLWKFRYGIRNEMSFHFYSEGLGAAVIFFIKTLRNASAASKWLFVPAIFLALARGCFFNYRRHIAYVGKIGE